MGKSTFIYLIIAVFVIFGGAIVYRNQQNQKIDEDLTTRKDIIEDIVNRPVQTVNSRYQYKDGTHTFVGNITAPTPCHSVDVELINRESETEIAITTAPSEEMCAQVITEKEFSVSFEGPEDQLIVASLNGEVVNLNLFEVPEDQDLSESIIDIKG